MIVLKWICFILVCLDLVGYIVEKADNVGRGNSTASNAGRFLGLCMGIAARVYILYGAAAYLLFASK